MYSALSGVCMFSNPSDSNFVATWAPKVCKIMAFRAVIVGLGRLCYILLGFR